MANRYYGDFRSIDTSADPKGQRYRVVIFTGYNGTAPYEYDERYITIQGHQVLLGAIPKNNYPLTMSDHPFIVSYEGDAENIYKPYRCSTAAIAFRQADINLDFLNGNGTNTLVLLLKWKNEIEERYDELYKRYYYYNTATGETLHKYRVLLYDEPLYNDYRPCDEDMFCYTVEWIGYSTPETFSMDYSHETDTFTLNAQDALSTLQFVKYKRSPEENELHAANDELLTILKQLCTYKKVYITDTLKFTNPQQGNSLADILTDISVQSLNNFNEDKKPVSCLEVVARIMKYLNLTAIPYRNELYITTPNAIAGGWGYYHTYTLPNNGNVMNWPDEAAQYTYTGRQYIGNTYEITENSYADGGTIISTANIYKTVTAEVDNYEVGDMMPDINNTDKFIADTNATVNYYSETVTQDGETVTNYYTWERKAVTPPAGGTITLKAYYPDPSAGQWSTSELNYVPSIIEYDKPSCHIIEHSGMQQTATANTLPMNSHYGRDFYFTGAKFYANGLSNTRADYLHNKNLNWQPMLIFDSDNVLMFAGDNLNLCGEWSFYQAKDHQTYLAPYTFGAKTAKSKAHTGQLNTMYNYVWGKVRVGGKWLRNTGESYAWRASETYVKLYIDWEEGKLAFSTPYEFKQTNRNIKGTCIPLPITGDSVLFGNVHIELDRPIGTYYYACTSAILKDFEVKVISTDGTRNRNVEFKTEVDGESISEHNVETAIGSQHTNGALWSEAVKGSTTYSKIKNVYNVATAGYALPETHLTTNIANQYKTPTIALQMTLHNDFPPYSLITWGKMANKRFIVDSAEIDYELNRQTVKITEVKATSPLTATKRDKTRNYKRNGDLIANETAPYDNKRTLTNDDLLRWENFDCFDSSDGMLQLSTTNNEATIASNITAQPNFNDGHLKVSVPADLIGGVAFLNAADRFIVYKF